MMQLCKRPGENDRQFIFRIGRAKENGTLDLSWSEITDIFNKELTEIKGQEDRLATSTYQQQYRIAALYYEDVFREYDLTEEAKEQISLIDSKRQELYKQQVKTQDINREYRRVLREEARDEQILSEITKVLESLPEITLPTERIISTYEEDKREFLFCLSDAHYGIEFEIKDLEGKVVNSYSPSIFEERMWQLYDEILQIVRKESIRELNIWELGDGIQGILRTNSQLMKLKHGIVESTILYANFLAEWLNLLSEHVHINFQMVVDSNHNQLRICNAPKNAFAEENMSKVMLAFLQERLKNNFNITIETNPTGLNYKNIAGFSVVGTHGEEKGSASLPQEFFNLYNTPIDYVVGGHKHHKVETEIGKNKESLSVRSLIGVDDYASSLRKASNPGAVLYCFEPQKGVTIKYQIAVE